MEFSTVLRKLLSLMNRGALREEHEFRDIDLSSLTTNFALRRGEVLRLQMAAYTNRLLGPAYLATE